MWDDDRVCKTIPRLASSPAAALTVNRELLQDMVIIQYGVHDDDESRDHEHEPEDWTNHVNYMDFIPDELLLKILLCMTPNERLVLERVSRRLRRLTVSLVQDFDQLTSLNKLSCCRRRKAILKYWNLSRLSIRDSDVLAEDFPRRLAQSCPLIEEFHIVSVHGLTFVSTFIKCLPNGESQVKRLVADMRFDAPGALDLIAGIVRLCPRMEEIVFFYPSRDSSRDLLTCWQKLSATGPDVHHLSLCINPGKEKEPLTPVDDNDFFWDLYENVPS